MGCSLLCPWSFPGKNTGVGCHFLLQGIYLTQGLNSSLASPVLPGRFFNTEPPGKPPVDPGGGDGLVAKSYSTPAMPGTVAHQAPLSMGFSRQEYWSGFHFLLQGIFPTQESNPGLPHCRQKLYRLSHQGNVYQLSMSLLVLYFNSLKSLHRNIINLLSHIFQIIYLINCRCPFTYYQ